MLEFLRKNQYGLMLAVAVMVIIAFAFLYDSQSYDSRRSGAPMQLYGKNISETKFRKYLSQAEVVSYIDQRTGPVFGFLDLYIALSGNRRSRGDNQDLVTNLLILREEAAKLGLNASEEEIEEAIKENFAFRSPMTGQFDEALFSDKKALMKNNWPTLNEGDFEQLFADTVVLRKLRELLKAGLRPSPITVDSEFAERNASIAAFRVDFPADKYAADAANVSDEELKKFFEENEDDYLAPEKRSAQFVLFRRPDLEKELEEAKRKLEESKMTPPEPAPDPSPEPKSDNKDDKKKAGDQTPEKAKESGAKKKNRKAKENPAESGAAEEKKNSKKKEENEKPVKAGEKDKSPSTEGAPAGDESPKKTETGGAQAEETDEPADTEPKDASTPPGESAPSAPAAEEIKKETTNVPPAPAPTPAEGNPSNSAADSTGTATPPAEGETKEPEPSAAAEPEVTEEERRQQNIDYDLAMNRFLQEVNENVDKFPEIAQKFVEESKEKSYSVEYFDTGLFERDDPPESLITKAGEPELGIIDAIYRRPKAQPLSREAVRSQDGGFVLYRLVESVDPAKRDFEEARENVKKDYVSKRQSEILRDAADENREKIEASMKEGKTFEEAAKGAGVDFLSIPVFSMSSPPPGIDDWERFSQAVSETTAGQFTDPVSGEDRLSLYYIAARELKDVEAESTKKEALKSEIANTNYDQLVFLAWLDRVREEAGAYKGDMGLGN